MINHVHSSVSSFSRPALQVNAVQARATTPDQSESDSNELNEADQARLRELKARDREVRAHEQAHLAAAGSLAQGGPSYSYERGPDQRLYAVGGEVQIDTSEVQGDPAATLRKAQIIRRAALAPNNPSAQDRSVAAAASQMASAASAELAQQDDSAEQEPTELSGAAQETRSTCPTCGAHHSSEAHEGLTAYAAISAADLSRPNLQIAATT